MDRSWMDAPRHTEKYLQGLAKFLGFAFNKSSVENKILCPCKNCVNSYWREESEVREHLVCEGFVDGYKKWMFHGERVSSSSIPPNLDEGDDRDEGDDISDLLRDLAAGLDKGGGILK
uniref:Transposase-associated domain-containing protein n=1 Tax=Triticum urartu TaxID=4572 RepID=A0A8R7QUJ0_TRIUA